MSLVCIFTAWSLALNAAARLPALVWAGGERTSGASVRFSCAAASRSRNAFTEGLGEETLLSLDDKRDPEAVLVPVLISSTCSEPGLI